MKKMLLSASAAFALSIAAFAAAPASAAVVDISGVNQQTANVRLGDTDQLAVAADIRVGQVSWSNIDTSADNLLNTVSNKVDVDQTAGLFNFLDYSAVNQQQLNLSLGPVDQTAVAIAGSGGVNNSNITTGALNSVNLAASSVTIKQ